MQPLIALLISDPGYRKLEFRAAFLLYFAVLAFGSIPGARAEVGEVASSLVLHLAAYAVITLQLFCGAQGSAWSKTYKSFLIVVAMGAVDEWVQSFFPYRSASLVDWFVDMNAGLFTSVALWSFWPKEPGENSKQLS